MVDSLGAKRRNIKDMQEHKSLTCVSDLIVQSFDWMLHVRAREGSEKRVEISRSVGCLSQWLCSSLASDNWRGNRLWRTYISFRLTKFQQNYLERME